MLLVFLKNTERTGKANHDKAGLKVFLKINLLRHLKLSFSSIYLAAYEFLSQNYLNIMIILNFYFWETKGVPQNMQRYSKIYNSKQGNKALFEAKRRRLSVAYWHFR